MGKGSIKGFLTTEEASAYIGRCPSALSYWRSLGLVTPFKFKNNLRSYYLKEELDSAIKAMQKGKKQIPYDTAPLSPKVTGKDLRNDRLFYLAMALNALLFVVHAYFLFKRYL